jgi:hypothetical protein
MKTTLILNTATVKVYQEKDGIILYMRLKDGGGIGKWVRNNAYAHDLKGLLGALTLSLDVLAGKVWPSTVVNNLPDEKPTEKYVAIGMDDDASLGVLGGDDGGN